MATTLKPLGKSFLFTFLDTSADGRFVDRNKGQIILTNKNLDDQGKLPRWGKVIALGNEVSEFGIDEYVLIEPLQWTRELRYEDKSYWKSDESKVMAVSNDESATYFY